MGLFYLEEVAVPVAEQAVRLVLLLKYVNNALTDTSQLAVAAQSAMILDVEYVAKHQFAKSATMDITQTEVVVANVKTKLAQLAAKLTYVNNVLMAFT